MSEFESDRKTFLLEWYKILWGNARGSMDGVWKLITPVAFVGVIWVAIYQEYIQSNLGITLIFIILFWAINITIDFNQWYRRNRIFFTAVERKFLNENDYGTIIPTAYKKPDNEWISFYKISLWTFIVVLCLAILCAAMNSICGEWPYHWLFLFAGYMISMNNFMSNEESAKKHLDELFPGWDDQQK